MRRKKLFGARGLLTLLLCISALSLSAQTITVRGTVTDANDEPLTGATVVVKGDPSKGAITDVDGKYTLANVPSKGTLTFSFVGMKSHDVEIDGRTVIDVSMKDDSEMLDEVVVVGFGTQKKENLTGAVATVNEKVLKGRPVTTVTQALQGAVAGMDISVGNGGGELGNSLGITIRGAGTIGNTSSSPLILIDGLEGNINALNPQDIESISVLKDAASASIYGSRAAFGVILIKTKSGKSGKISVTYNNNFRWSSPLLRPKMLDSERFAEYFNEAAKNGGQAAPFNDETLKKIRDYKAGKIPYETEWNESGRSWSMYTNGFANNNWYDIFYRDNVPSQEHNISSSGGTEAVNFYFSANWLGQDGLMKFNPDKRDRYSVDATVNAQVHKMLKLKYSGKFSRVDYGRSSYDHGLFYHNIARRWPTLPLKDPNGNYVYGNEIAHLNNGRNEEQTDEFIQQLALVFTPIKGWNTHVELNYKTGTKFTHVEILPIYSYDKNGVANAAALQFGSFWSGGQSRITEYGRKWNFFNPNIYTEYIKSINDTHNFKVMAGFQSELDQSRGLGAWREQVYTPDVPAIDATYGDNDGVNGYFNHWATAGFFGRLNYDYMGKYLVELNGRYDGSSRFLRDKRWNFFPSFSLGWNVAKESFWTDSPLGEYVSTLKLRGSYGELGNQNIVDEYKNPIYYPFYLNMPVGVADGNWLVNGKKTNRAWAPGLVSQLLTWERVNSWNIGADINAFNNRLNIVFDYFQRRTFDMVGPAPQLPNVLGTDVPKINNTDMESKGFELEISWRDRIGELSYGVKATLADSRQTVTKYPNENKKIYYYDRNGGRHDAYYSGKEIGEIWGFTTVGIAKTDAEMTEHIKKNKPTWGSDWAGGDIMYKDLNNDNEITRGEETVDNPGDLKVIGNNTPRYNFGIDIDMQWRGFDFRAFFQGVGKRDLAVGGPYFTGGNGNMWQNAGFEEHLDFYRPADTKSFFGPNEDAYYPRPSFDKGWKNFETQTRWIQNGAYMRLKNLQLGYTIPSVYTQKIGVSNFRVYVSGENLLTFTKMTKIFDPETFLGGWGNGKIYPLSRVWSCGLSVTF